MYKDFYISIHFIKISQCRIVDYSVVASIIDTFDENKYILSASYNSNTLVHFRYIIL